ncbi:hypothetical protein QQF64_000902 [Cirrhinus molitorella]|uniref:Thioredoxin domain-containing protein n=1 Tax=Cirrhinus molitorella TaxID=172907 RepID=A0ABR3NYV8_9TELE
MIIVIEDQESFDKALAEAGDKLVVVDFTATWCGPCQSIAPFYKGLSESPDNANVVFLKVDVDDAQDVAQSCEVKCMPTFHFYKNGKKLDEFSGSNQAKLEDMGSLFQLHQAAAFKIVPADGSLTHHQITEAAFFRKMMEVCRDVATSRGKTLYYLNTAVDRKQFSTAHHFDNEDFKNGRDLITQGIAAVKVNIKNGKFLSARTRLGAVCHTLQDFYSHSNWVELGSTAPFSTLIKPELPLNNLAGPNTKTCKSCVGKNCTDNILPEVLQQKILTSGYFRLFSSSKPAGKCSHGGFFDRTSLREPTGGINKDDISSDHGFLHIRAAEMAIKATMELLEDIRLATDDQTFLRLMGLNQTSVLAFVFDVTGSLSNYIEVFKRVSFSIIDSRRGTSEEPSEYILVPFNEQGSGPLLRTENADTFKEHINSISASVRGSFSNMCLSGLLLTLPQAPPSSDIFVFTDASAKDSELKSAVEALIESTKSTVNFLLANSFSLHSEKDVSSTSLVSLSDIQLYRDLAHVSGGQTIEVTNTTVSQVTAVIKDAFTSDLVTVLQIKRNFTLYSPTGVSQSGSVADGPLGRILTIGNLRRVKLNSAKQTGVWMITVNSTSSYTIKVIGRNATFFVSVSGRDSVTVTDVLLVEASGSDVVSGTIKSVGATDFLVNIDRIPEWPFVVQLKGLLNDSSSASQFQRQSPVHHKGSRITVTAQSQNIIQPGVPLSLNFTLTTNTTGGNYTIRVRTDQGFSVSFHSSLTLRPGGSAQGSVTLTAPFDTESGTDVTLTIEAEAPGSTDLNYITLQLTVSTANAIFSGLAVFLLQGSLFHTPQAAAFKIFPSDGSLTHQQITEAAFLRKMAEVCRNAATAQGKDFTLPINNKLTPTTVQRACSNSYSTLLKLSTFNLAVVHTSLSNAAVDRKQLSTAHHFDSEDFKNGRDLITQGVAAVKVSIKKGNYLSARTSLGAVCHTLQDFYSHSNWMELGNTAPFSTLIKPERPFDNLAGPNTKTCKSCVGDNCSDNILTDVLQQKLLTSGYFDFIFSNKPAGKCSHGGFFDRTSSKEPTGGINKDDISSNHGFLHLRAADMAINATMELLEDIRLATGDQAFLRLMGLSQTSVLAFVFDITGIVSYYIAEAKKVFFNIIDSRKGTSEEPSEYILVVFNDQDFRLVIRTGDADKFKEQINSLSASDSLNPGMCLSGLLLTLTRAPPSSDIFVFTEASAKDTELKSTVAAMMQITQSKVTFLLTNSISTRSQQNVSLSRLSQSDIQLYRDLAQVSGGQTIEVTNSTFSQATSVITDVIATDLVTVLQVERNFSKAENFLFVLDPTLSNVTVYITGDSPVFTLYSPTGVSQSGSVADGPLGNIQTVGNLKRVKLNSDNQTGEWKLTINSTSSYSLKVIGQSSVDVLFYFVEIVEGGHGDSWGQRFTRPFTGRNATFYVSVTGRDSVTVSDVLLVEASGSGVVNGTIKSVGATEFLVSIDSIPEWPFVVQLKGLLNDSSVVSRFQRQSSTQHKGSRITVTAQSQNTAQPGVPLSLNFTVATNITGGTYTIRARTDQGFSMSFSSSLTLGSGGSAQGSVTLTAPFDTESGTDVALTIEAEAPGSTDLNYITLQLTVAAFKPLLQGGSLTHREITQLAILHKTAEVCRDIAIAQGRDFTLPINNRLTPPAVQRACSASSSSALGSLGFYSAITETYLSNAAIDAVFVLSKTHHIDNEAFSEGRDLIIRGVAAVKASMQQGSYISARITLGALCHTLQDFYSHSNWVELGNTAPFRTLIKPELPLNNIADPSTPTCRSCIGPNCADNILPEILLQKKLTSGYFSIFSSTKPAGKCSHGGSLDRTSSSEPTGGINKDDISSDHGFLHLRAADMAINATVEVLQDIRLATGDQAFLQLMGLSQTSVLAFVIDTTGSMSDDIEEAKRVSFNIIDSRRGTPKEPSEYILVPFNDPDFGPLTRTDDADIFKDRINSLSASGGGDLPEMCLSGLLLALAGTPPSSDIFVFTDAAAKDLALQSTIRVMIERTKSTVTFLLTNPFSFRRRRDVSQSQSFTSRSISESEIQLYRDLAHVSGGQAIEVTKATLSQATAVITDASTAALVMLFQVVRSPAIAENFSFVLDSSLFNVTVYVTGDSPVFTIYSPTGVSQSGSVADGPLGSILTVGNLKRVKLNSDNQTGEWKISIDSTNFYSLKVTGQSSVNFLFNFVEQLEGGDFTPKASRPFMGRNTTLFVSVTGGDSVTVTDVLLVEASGSNIINGTIKTLGATDFLVNIDRIPEWTFVVQLKGLLIDSNRSLPSRFQRQSPTQQQGSRVTITVQPSSTIEPGIPLVLNFTLVTNATEGSAEGTVTLTAPSDTESGTDVTLTIEAEDSESGDSNYVAMRFTVMTKVTDFSSPVCQVVSIKTDCPVECSRASWGLSANLTDINGTGIAGVSLSRGNGSLSLSNVMSPDGTNVTVASYNASCCSQEVELVAVDRVGNVGTCFASIRSPSTTISPNGSYSVSFSMCLALVGLIVSFCMEERN